MTPNELSPDTSFCSTVGSLQKASDQEDELDEQRWHRHEPRSSQLILRVELICNAGDLKEEKVPQHFSELLLETHRNHEESEQRRRALQCFATRTLPAVSASQTRFDKCKCSKSLSNCFICTDEALGLLPVVSCERQWRSQHNAVMSDPAWNEEGAIR